MCIGTERGREARWFVALDLVDLADLPSACMPFARGVVDATRKGDTMYAPISAREDRLGGREHEGHVIRIPPS